MQAYGNSNWRGSQQHKITMICTPVYNNSGYFWSKGGKEPLDNTLLTHAKSKTQAPHCVYICI